MKYGVGRGVSEGHGGAMHERTSARISLGSGFVIPHDKGQCRGESPAVATGRTRHAQKASWGRARLSRSRYGSPITRAFELQQGITDGGHEGPHDSEDHGHKP